MVSGTLLSSSVLTLSTYSILLLVCRSWRRRLQRALQKLSALQQRPRQRLLPLLSRLLLSRLSMSSCARSSSRQASLPHPCCTLLHVYSVTSQTLHCARDRMLYPAASCLYRKQKQDIVSCCIVPPAGVLYRRDKVPPMPHFCCTP